MADALQVLPADAHNERLVSHVHPPNWTNPTPDGRYNLVVIGAGTAGLVTALGAAGLGAKVALIEKHLMGGDCLNVGCVPSKALIRAARAFAAVRDAGRFGVEVPEPVKVNFAEVMQRMRRLRADISHHDSAERFRDLGVDVFIGSGSFSGPDTINVEGQTLHFKRAVIATGARAAAPPIPELAQVDSLTNETVFSLTELPARFAVIGAGPIGCEMAQCFARFGSEVHLIESTHGILPREDEDAAAIVKESLLRDGIRLLCCGKQTTVSKDAGGIRIRLESHGENYDIVVDQMLVAVGRAPNVEGLNLDSVGVTYDTRVGVKVDDRLRTTNPRIYAAGDICFPYKFTHTADFQARIVIKNALFMGRDKTSALTIPWCTYTTPEIAHVGLYEAEARQKGLSIQTFTQPLAEVDRAILDGETDGFVKVHVKSGTDEILGATIVAAHAGEMISEITLAMVANSRVPKWLKFCRLASRIGLSTVGSTIHPYPTQTEAVRKLGDIYNRTRLTPFVKSLMNKWLSWTR